MWTFYKGLLHFVAFNVGTLNRRVQQVALARTLVSNKINACRVSERPVYDAISVITFRSSNTTSFSPVTLRISGDSVSDARDQASIGAAMDMREEHALLD